MNSLHAATSSQLLLLTPCQTLGKPNESLIDGKFRGESWNPLPTEIVERVKGKSWKNDCPVPLEDLAYIRVTHWNLKNQAVIGELVYHKNLAPEIIDIFKELFESHFPIEKMVLIDNYNADDELSMGEDNTSAFCSRAITGKPGTFSKHSYGGTIDINPFMNPYVKGNIILPNGSESFCDRTQNLPGMIKEGDSCYNAFAKRGYSWGGHFSHLKDYQHFEKNPDLFI